VTETTPTFVSRRIAWVYAGHGIVHAYAFVFPTLMLFIKREFGVSWVALGIVTTLSSLSLGLASVPAGLAVDRFGPRPALILALLWCGLSSAVAAMAPTLGWLAVASVLFGVGLALFHSGAIVYVTTARPGSGRALAWYGIGGGVGMAAAPVVLAGFAALTSCSAPVSSSWAS
jgi:MFS transporter, FSR family, fosmidomycin resistance protein